MHKKDRGTIAELAVAKDLMKRGYSVFSEFGDNSVVDLIALRQGEKPILIQVKATSSNNGKVQFSLKKSGPNGYVYFYLPTDFDLFALYVEDLENVLYVKNDESLNKHTMTFRVTPSNYTNQHKVRNISEHDNTAGVLRDYEQHNQNG